MLQAETIGGDNDQRENEAPNRATEVGDLDEKRCFAHLHHVEVYFEAAILQAIRTIRGW